MFKDRYGSEFKTKVNKWLQTFDAYVRDGDFDDAETESVESQRAEGDANSVQDNSDVEMQSAASADDLDEAEQVLWNDMVRGSALPNVEGGSSSSDLAVHEQQLWEDILRNSSLPDYDAYETQEGVNADAVSDDGDVVSIEVQAESDVDEDSNDDPDIEDDEPDIEDDEHDVEDDEQDDISGATEEHHPAMDLI
ncbi:hypothetical protein DVH05_017180 [Phytophthora capsici]|nr:hypothetical protein DVH05_017180 [Phytophthora capsici]